MSSPPSDHGPQELLGSSLERRYRVDSVIARGGMSTVYRGVDTRLDRPVALKVMDARYAGDPSFTERFEREARAAARLHHPNIVAVYDQGVDPGQPGQHHVYLVMQLVEGSTLRELLRRRGRLSPAVALSALEAVLAALSAAHRAGMVHRDVKPENILLGEDGAVRVTDFGLVRAAAGSNTTGDSVILGTVAYLSPEQVATGAADARSDVYAAGVVLYELLTGRPPYTGDTAISVAYRHVNEDVDAPGEHVDGVPAALDRLVTRFTRRDPAHRPVDGAAALRELRTVRDELGLAPVPVPAPSSSGEQALPTARLSPSSESVPAETNGRAGPLGTRALHRPGADVSAEESTSELAPVPATDSPAEGGKRSGRRRARVPTVLGLVVLLVGALVTGGALWWNSSSYVKVPELAGRTLDEAKQRLRAAELDVHVSRSFHDTVPENTVIGSTPQQGTRIRTGDRVDLRVSRGRPTVPEIEPGSRVAEVESKLRTAGLKPERDSEAERYHDSVPKGRVIGVTPSPGSEVNTESTVTIIVSKGPPPEPVPDVRGTEKEKALRTLRSAGFDPRVSGHEFAEDVPHGHVVRTDPSAGTEVPMDGEPRVEVVLSSAVSVPNFSGKQLDEARRRASEAGLELKVESLFGRENGRVFGQFPLPGSTVEEGSKVRVTVF
ncbi:Stk1 family PASTA domain-containing Ser/Thr kinase [Actinopolyspora mortivallis]|uniref:non-specific serine/threonine protein kinase n=1 Tax=Actinopolyspora mortivallis TaxID=33906 RepID=A0A2T0H183_ACTMO|nr:Stk1 family PASTA domain-containing Ser/Thr kinase [Actinopolyspora mortivallis]PRW65013.1 Stk1 family PASTA domain-containing Ser/Thr kinase [Actinopolyspora mortivallis]